MRGGVGADPAQDATPRRAGPADHHSSPLLSALEWWEHSLRVRVITTTVLVGLALAALLGTVLYQQIAQGLVEQAVDNAERDASQQVALAQDAFDSTDRRDDAGLSLTANDQVQSMAGGNPKEGRRVLLLPALDNERDSAVQGMSVGIDASALPETLPEAIAADPENQQVVVVPVQLIGQDAQVTSVVVGSRVSLLRAGAYDLFLVYPMVREQETLDLVRQLFFAAGFALVLLVAGVGWLARHLEGDDEVVECEGATPCPLRSACKLRMALREAQDAFYASLDPLTVTQLTAGPTGPLLISLSSRRPSEN